MWINLSAETAVDLIARRQGIDTRKGHFRRSGLARRLHELNVFDDKDLGDLLIRLNNERKHAVYEGKAPDLRGRSWEQVFAQVEKLIAVAERS